MPSSVIAHIHYLAADLTLRIVFLSGDVYDYKNVPLDVYQAMNASASKGTFLNEIIKGFYDFEKIV